MLTRLPDPQIIELAGNDALAFAQAQFSSDATALADGTWQWSAWLSAQGRVRAFFALLRIADDRLLLILRGGSASHLRDALARYILRAKVTVRAVTDLQTLLTDAPSDIESFSLRPDAKRLGRFEDRIALAMPGTAQRWMILAPQSAAVEADDSLAAVDSHALADIDAGLPTLAEAIEDKLLPDWIGLGELGAVSVRKGCYPGQEIVARLHFKGGNKRWPYRIAFSSSHLPAPGTQLSSNDSDIGLVICSAWSGRGEGRALVCAADDAAAALSSATVGELTARSAELVVFAV